MGSFIFSLHTCCQKFTARHLLSFRQLDWELWQHIYQLHLDSFDTNILRFSLACNHLWKNTLTPLSLFVIYTSSKSTLGAHWRVTALVIHVKDSKEKVGFNLESARTFFIELLGIDGRRPRENTFVCKSSNNYSGQHREEWGGGNRWSTHRRVNAVNAHRHCVAATVAVASTPLSLLMLWFFVGLPAHLTFQQQFSLWPASVYPVGASPVSMGRRDLDYDEVLRYIGQFGTFQVILVDCWTLREKENIDRKGSSSGFGSYLQEVDWLWWSLLSQVHTLPLRILCLRITYSFVYRSWASLPLPCPGMWIVQLVYLYTRGQGGPSPFLVSTNEESD